MTKKLITSLMLIPLIAALFSTPVSAAGLLIPSEEFWQYNTNKIEGRFREKLPFQTYLDTIGRLRDVSGALDGDASILDFTYEIGGQEFQLDIARHIAPHIYTIRTVITGLYIIFIVSYNYRQVMFLIRGKNFNQGVTNLE